MRNDNGRHIFFVDDEPNIRQVIAETLEQSSLHVTCFACPTECLEQLSAHRCDLLITDLKMPKMDGIELAREIKHRCLWMLVLILNWLRRHTNGCRSHQDRSSRLYRETVGQEEFCEESQISTT